MFNGLISSRKIFFLFYFILLVFSQHVFSNTLNTAIPWTGFFIGGYSGIAHDNTSLSTDAGSLSNISYFISNANIASVNQNGSASIGHNDFIIGTELGYNHQYQQLVYGVETDFGYLGIRTSKQSNNIVYPTAAAFAYTMNVAMNTSWLLTTKINIGVTPSSLREWIYLTGGLALTEMHVSNSFSDNATSAGRESAQNNQLKAGWALGTGLKIHSGTHWLIGFEYLFVKFNAATASGKVVCTNAAACIANVNSPLDTSAKFYASLAKLSVDYLF